MPTRSAATELDAAVVADPSLELDGGDADELAPRGRVVEPTVRVVDADVAASSGRTPGSTGSAMLAMNCFVTAATTMMISAANAASTTVAIDSLARRSRTSRRSAGFSVRACTGSAADGARPAAAPPTPIAGGGAGGRGRGPQQRGDRADCVDPLRVVRVQGALGQRGQRRRDVRVELVRGHLPAAAGRRLSQRRSAVTGCQRPGAGQHQVQQRADRLDVRVRGGVAVRDDVREPDLAVEVHPHQRGCTAPRAMPLRCASATASEILAVIEVATSGSSGPPESRSVRVAPSTHWPTT